MTPHKIGTRVVCPYPEPFVGTVVEAELGRVVVKSGGLSVSWPADEVLPAMPRDRHDVDRDRWWWRNGRPVWVTWTASGVVWSPSPGWPYGSPVTLADDWAGPVAPPPEVRHG